MSNRWEATQYQAEVAMAVFEGDDWRRCRDSDECIYLLEEMRKALTKAVGSKVDGIKACADAIIFAVQSFGALTKALEDLNAEASEKLSRAHAAIHWVATVRAVITSGMLNAHGPYARHGLCNVLVVAHAASEVWLSGEPVTAQAIANLLGWNSEYGANSVREWLRPLQTGTYPPLVTDDGQPNIEVRC
jgi:hypothetical protein